MFKRVKKRQVYRAIIDVKMLGMVMLKVAGSSGFNCTIPKGTKIIITHDSWPWPISKGTYAVPLNYKELEDKLVPLEERESTRYRFYILCLDFKDLRYFVREEKIGDGSIF